VILNRVAGRRHLDVITAAVDKYCHLAVLGAIPKLGRDEEVIPGRHLGLVTPVEFKTDDALGKVLDEIAGHLQIDRIMDIAHSAPPLNIAHGREKVPQPKTVNIGYFRDSVFTFYYPENLEALAEAGANLIPVSAIDDNRFPASLDALYIGGGFPETQAERLSCNRSLMQEIKAATEKGLPVYAECGGLIYLGKSLIWGNRRFAMTGIFPVNLVMNTKPAGHGYTVLTVDDNNPFYPAGTRIKGHEFHYTSIAKDDISIKTCFRVERGTGFGNRRDGLVHKNCLALYTHIHADAVREWAPAMVHKAREYRRFREGNIIGNFRIAI
jgi:cobyrinic acid a,c-diamide synthase